MIVYLTLLVVCFKFTTAKFTGKLKVSSYKIKIDNKLESGIPFKDKKTNEKEV